MPLPPLPNRDADAWDLHQAFQATTPIHGVSARSGRVIAVGAHRHRLQKGAIQWQGQELPDDIPGPARLVALDPLSEKYALSTDAGLHIFLGKKAGDRVANVRPATEEGEDDEEAVEVDGLAWGRVQGQPALFTSWTSGKLGILFPDTGAGQDLELPPMAALAYDDAGTVAMFTFEGGGNVYVTKDGERYEYRGLDVTQEWIDSLPEEGNIPVHLAVAGKAVAWSFGWYGAFVSRDFPNEPFERCEPLAHAGALAFEGSSPDAALFGAVHTEEYSSIVRVDASGKAMRIGDLIAKGQKPVPFDELAWDASRKCLFAVHREVGLVVAAAPDAKRGKLPAPS